MPAEQSPNQKDSITRISVPGMPVFTGTMESRDNDDSISPAAKDADDPKLSRVFKTAAIMSATAVFFAGALAATGWAFGIDILKHPTVEPAIQGPASIDFILLSLSLALLCIGTPRMWRNISARVLAAVVLVASAAAFIEHTGHIELDHLLQLKLWPELENHGLGLLWPGPLLPHESFSLLVLALGTGLYNISIKSKFWPGQALSALVFAPSFIILFCYMMGQSSLCIYFGCVQLSPIFSRFCSTALLFSLPTRR